MPTKIVAKTARRTTALFRTLGNSWKRSVTDLYSPFGVPGKHLVSTGRRVKVVIDPKPRYFLSGLTADLRRYDRVLAIHGCEPPEVNDIRRELMAHGGQFARLHTFDDEVRNAVSGSEPFCFGSCWVLTDGSGNPVDLRQDYRPWFSGNKQFQLSFLHSAKRQLIGHRLRHEIAPLLQQPRRFEVLFPQKRIPTKVPLLEKAMFHVAVENTRHDNYFTEKIIDCFMSYTVPIYWGCPNLERYFDMRGVITFETPADLERTLHSLTPDDYHSRREAVHRNYEIAAGYYAFFYDRLNDYLRAL